jgi:hypothetical protein
VKAIKEVHLLQLVINNRSQKEADQEKKITEEDHNKTRLKVKFILLEFR